MWELKENEREHCECEWHTVWQRRREEHINIGIYNGREEKRVEPALKNVTVYTLQ